jgi:hypothetical protein
MRELNLKIETIKTPEDVLRFMDEKVEYGWIDGSGKVHRDMKGFRTEYRIAPTEECLRFGVGTCIEQVILMHTLFDKLKIPNRMYCCRVYEPDDFGNPEEEEHMHCFLLYDCDGKVFHIEHPNFYRIGIFEYESESAAVQAIEQYYIELRGGRQSPTAEFYAAVPGLSFRQFNAYINSLDRH